jgi:mono/diheme cytochrome c family protein
MKSSLYVALACLPLLSSAAMAADAAATGQHLFAANNCYQCHGYLGQGGQGPTIAPPQLPAEPAFMAYVRHPGAEMPAFTEKVLSDADLMAIYAYLKSLPPPPAALPDLLKEPLGSR